MNLSNFHYETLTYMGKPFFNLKLSSNVRYPEQKCLILKVFPQSTNCQIQLIVDLEKNFSITNFSLESITISLYF